MIRKIEKKIRGKSGKEERKGDYWLQTVPVFGLMQEEIGEKGQNGELQAIGSI